MKEKKQKDQKRKKKRKDSALHSLVQVQVQVLRWS